MKQALLLVMHGYYNVGTTVLLNKLMHESIHILMEDIGDFVAFKQLVTCLYNIQFGQQHDS